MRIPNPPRVHLGDLTPEQTRKVIVLALEVVHDLALDKEWDAYGKIQQAELTLEERLSFASLLNSKQGAVIASISQVAHDKR